jgi:hypothetical protein
MMVVLKVEGHRIMLLSIRSRSIDRNVHDYVCDADEMVPCR